MILLSYFMILLDNSIIFTGTVKIAATLHLTQNTLSWVSSAYSLTFGGFLLVGGRAGDLFGRRRVFQIGLVIFGIGSFLVGAANSAMLIIGASVGLVIGGLLASLLSWRIGFFINVPIAAWMFYLSARHLHQDATQQGKLDWLGTFTSLFGMITLVYSIVGTVGQLYSLIAAIVLLGVFIAQEDHTAQPIMPLRLFTNLERNGANISHILYMGAMLGFWFITPQIMQSQLGFTPLMAGIGFFPLTIVNFIVALQVARLTKKLGNGGLLIIGIFLTFAGMFWISRFTPSTGYWLGIALPMILLGIGQGLALSPFTAAGVAHTEARDAGAASGVVNVMHQLGGSIGLSILVAVQGLDHSVIAGFQHAILTGSGLLFLALLAAIFLVLPGERRAH